MLPMISLLLAAGISGASNVAAADGKCMYTLEKGSEAVEWTAFKTTEKVGVKGRFKRFSVAPAKSPAGAGARPGLEVLLRGTTFKIDVSTVDTGVPMRDETIFKNFFQLVNGGKTVTGKIHQTKKTGAESGSARVSLDINGKPRDLQMDYRLEDGVIEFTGTLDAPAAGMGRALESLNRACHDLHKGADGVSKTWPTVDLKVTAKVAKSCG